MSEPDKSPSLSDRYWRLARLGLAVPAVLALATACGSGAGSYDDPGCSAARDYAVVEGKRWLADIETPTGRAPVLDRAVLNNLFAACSGDPEGAYSDFLVRTHSGFDAVSPGGEVVRREFLSAGCGERNPYPLEQLSSEARRVCTGG